MKTFPDSLRLQFRLVFAIMLGLFGVSLYVSIREMEAVNGRMVALSGLQLQSLRTTARIATLADGVSIEAAHMLLADDEQVLAARADSLQRRMTEIEDLLPQLIQDDSGDDILDLSLHSQAFRIALNVVLALRQASLHDDEAFRRAVAMHMERGDSGDDLLRLVLATSAAEVESPEPAAASGDRDPFTLRRKALARREALRRYSVELREQGGRITALARAAADSTARRYDLAIASHLAASRKSEAKLAMLLIASLVLGFLPTLYLVRRRIVLRMDAISTRLRGDAGSVDARKIPVYGRDEIGRASCRERV